VAWRNFTSYCSTGFYLFGSGLSRLGAIKQIFGLLVCIITTNILSRAATGGSPYKEILIDCEFTGLIW
ncbi:MAG: hypothetical protein RQ728_09665, partial [Brevefilum sp.]|nr:hypothetical protein [Brevefilum sp.]